MNNATWNKWSSDSTKTEALLYFSTLKKDDHSFPPASHRLASWTNFWIIRAVDSSQQFLWQIPISFLYSYFSKFIVKNIVSPQAESAPEPAPPAPEPSAPPAPASGGAEEEEVDKLEVDKVDEPLTFSPMAEEASEAGAIPMAANAIRQEAEMAHNEAIS